VGSNFKVGLDLKLKDESHVIAMRHNLININLKLNALPSIATHLDTPVPTKRIDRGDLITVWQSVSAILHQNFNKKLTPNLNVGAKARSMANLIPLCSTYVFSSTSNINITIG